MVAHQEARNLTPEIGDFATDIATEHVRKIPFGHDGIFALPHLGIDGIDAGGKELDDDFTGHRDRLVNDV